MPHGTDTNNGGLPNAEQREATELRYLLAQAMIFFTDSKVCRRIMKYMRQYDITT